MNVDYLGYFKGLVLVVAGHYDEALTIMEEVHGDIRHEIGGRGFNSRLSASLRRSQDLLREQDELYSIEWLQKASESGCFQAGCILGLHYLIGKGVEKNCRKAISLIETSAECVDSERPSLSFVRVLTGVLRHTPDYVLGCIFSSDEYVEADYLKALKHYERAAKMGSFSALLGALWILEGADGVSPIDIDEAEKLCADMLIQEIVELSTWNPYRVDYDGKPGQRWFLQRKLEDYAKIGRYKIKGEILPLARWVQKTGLPQERIV